MNANTKHIYGAYLNMARQNAYITLSHISKLQGDDKKGDEANLAQMKAIRALASKKPEEVDRAIKLLHKHFPFLKAMADNELGQMAYQEDKKNEDKKGKDKKINTPLVSPDKYSVMLEGIFETLNLLRNQYSHYQFVDKKLADEKHLEYNKKVVHGLKRSFEGGRRIVKERFEIKDEDLKFIIDNIRKPVDKIDEKTGQIAKDNRGRKMKRFVEDERFFYKLDNEDKLLSSKGTALFICLLLEKKYITQFLDSSELKFFPKGASEQEKKIIREIYSVYRIRLPRTRIESDRPESALGLDMLSELKKCPDELFETLSKKDQEKFRILTENAEGKDDADSNEILMKRYNNRFPYFTLRYIDDKKLFNDIRFQVSLGKYRYKFYEKEGVDSVSADRIRILQKELNGFGRITDIEQQRQTKWKNLIRPFEKIRQDTAEEKPYITDHRASYVLNGNKIGLAFKTGKEKSFEHGYYLPTIEPRDDKDYKAEEVENRKPNCWLSTHELPAMVFHHLLCDGNDGAETEKIIKTYVTKYHELFSNIREGKLVPSPRGQIEEILKRDYNLEFKNIPKKLQNYLTNKQIDIDTRFKKLADERLDKMIASTERRIESLAKDRAMIGSKDNKLGKKNYVDIRPGRLARFLSEDIVLMQPSINEGKNKPTGMNFQIIQSSLAIYDKTVDQLREMFDKAGLTKGNYQHPFLNDVLGEYPNDCIIFYKAYLEHRLNYLNTCRADNKEYSSYSFLYSKRDKWEKRSEEYYKKLAAKYLELQPVELPRGLFNESIKERLRNKHGNNEGIKAALSQERCNTSYLIAEYFKHVCNDTNQEFYIYSRTYDFYNNLQDNRSEKERTPKNRIYSSQTELEMRTDKNTLVRSIGEYMKKKVGHVKEVEQSLTKDPKYTPYIDAFMMLDESQFTGPFKKEFKRIKQRIEDCQGVEYIEPIKTLLKSAGINIDKMQVAESTVSGSIYSNLKYEEFPEYKKIMDQIKDYNKNEKLIRQYKVQDMLLFLMAKDILINTDWGKERESIKNEIKGCKLENIEPQGAANILMLPVPFSITLKLEGGDTKTIKQDNLKLKNYGDFFRFLYDDRIKTLLPQVESAIIDRETLEKELESYDLSRTVVFKLVQDYEKYLLMNKEVQTGKESSSFRDIVIASNLHSEVENNKLIAIRNAFCHNHYRTKDIVKLDDIPKAAATYTRKLEKLTEKNK